jgi:hypothetical protein
VTLLCRLLLPKVCACRNLMADTVRDSLILLLTSLTLNPAGRRNTRQLWVSVLDHWVDRLLCMHGANARILTHAGSRSSLCRRPWFRWDPAYPQSSSSVTAVPLSTGQQRHCCNHKLKQMLLDSIPFNRPAILFNRPAIWM